MAFGLHPDTSVVGLDDPLGEGQAEAGTVLVFPLQPFEELEDPNMVPRLDPHTVVLDIEDRLFAPRPDSAESVGSNRCRTLNGL